MSFIFFEKICGVAPLPLQPKNFAQNNSVLIQIANNTFLSVYPCSQDRIRTCIDLLIDWVST
jgi:hypothetical protein